ncbi:MULTISPECIES: PilW family protein [Methylococcus]|uniref:PilW family protein n=1 Tax=Methylococcus capsulatus TaxID=414 RepID=A0ABZ2F9C3_METCP|nr:MULTISPECIES: PilW family protein [Methylococcus]MDF9392640.1 pilin-like protein [Methylococcus capsulatus]
MKIPTRDDPPGFSTVELLISMALGLLVVGAIGSLFVQHKTNYRQNEQFALMQENGRFALNLLTSDLALAGFWGGADCNDLSRCPSASAISVQNDCGTNWTTTTTSSSPATHYLMAPSADSIPADWPCFNSNDYLKPGTNLLALRHAEGKPVHCQTEEDKRNDRFAGLIYLRTGGSSGSLIQSPVPPDCPVSFSSAAYWRYIVHIYYIDTKLRPAICASKPNDGRCIPRLMRKTLTRETKDGKTTPKIEDEPGELVEGIEYFHIEFGIDDPDLDVTNDCDNMDGVPDFYLLSREDYGAITPAHLDELDCAVSARVHVLVRSMESDSNYTDDKTYTFGAVTLGPFGDHFRRKVFTTTVQLRNQQYH